MACWWHFCYSKLSQLAGSSLSTSFAEILVLLTWEWNVYRAIPTCNEWVYFWRLIPIFSPVQFRLLKQRGSGDCVSPSAQGERSKFSRSSLEFIQSQFSLICLLLLWKWHLFKFTLFIMADTLFVCLFTPSPSSNCLLQIICDFFFSPSVSHWVARRCCYFLFLFLSFAITFWGTNEKSGCNVCINKCPEEVKGFWGMWHPSNNPSDCHMYIYGHSCLYIHFVK